MNPEEFFDQMFNYFNTKRNEWYLMFITPRDWGSKYDANIPMGYEFDICFSQHDVQKISIEVPDKFWEEHVEDLDTCSPHGIGRVLPISNNKCIGHNHPKCAAELNHVQSNELPTGTDITGLVNVANKLGSAWSFVISSVGLACYWITEHGCSNFDAEEYDWVALRALENKDVSEALIYLKNCGIMIKLYTWN